MKSQRAEDVMSNDGKNELDLGIQESIRRCEALLAMVPSSFQPILIDGVFFHPLSSLQKETDLWHMLASFPICDSIFFKIGVASLDFDSSICLHNYAAMV